MLSRNFRMLDFAQDMISRALEDFSQLVRFVTTMTLLQIN